MISEETEETKLSRGGRPFSDDEIKRAGGFSWVSTNFPLPS